MAREFKAPGLTPEYVYRGRPADFVSVKNSKLESGQDQVVKKKLFGLLEVAIQDKWTKYGKACIAVPNISNWPDHIRTRDVVRFIIEKFSVTSQGQSVLLIRVRDGRTKVRRIFDS